VGLLEAGSCPQGGGWAVFSEVSPVWSFSLLTETTCTLTLKATVTWNPYESGWEHELPLTLSTYTYICCSRPSFWHGGWLGLSTNDRRR
jgi:hypothetical protein